MGKRLALIIGNSVYQDQTLARLKAPDVDVGSLHDVLTDPEVGGFDDVDLLVNSKTSTVRRIISEFFARKSRDDLLLFYFSGHGVLDDRGRLHLAVKDTDHSLLRGTAVAASFIADEMDNSRSQRQIIILDCCHSGAFARGAKGSPGLTVGTASAFEGTGFGRVVLTATDATQYAWEGERIIGEAESSLFTHYMVQGLQSGEADINGDGRITVDELFDYVYTQIVKQTPKQTPGKWSFKEQGEIVIARAGQWEGAPPIVERKPFVDSELNQKLEQLYTKGLSAHWLEEWEQAAHNFQQILEINAEYQDATERFAEVRRQLKLKNLYDQALAAFEAQKFTEAIAVFEALVAEAPDYKDAASKLQSARKKGEVGELYSQAKKLHEAAQWQAVINIFDRIAELSPEYADPDDLLTTSKREFDRQEHLAEIKGRYRQALQAMNSGRWHEARNSFARIQEEEPGFQDSERLLTRVEAEISRQEAQRQDQERVGILYEQAISLFLAHQWRQALEKIEEIRVLDPEFPDPEGIAGKMKAEEEREEQEARRQEELATLYAEAVQLFRVGKYQEALEMWDEIKKREPRYPDQHKVQVTSRKKLASIGQETLLQRFKRPYVLISISILLILASMGLILTFLGTYELAFTSDRDGKSEIYRLTSEGKAVRVTNSPRNAESWEATLNSRGQIVFTSNRDGKREIYRLTSEGKVVRVTNSPRNAESWEATLDSRGQIVFTSNRDGKREIYRLTSEGEVVRVSYSPGKTESWEPNLTSDGQILFTSNRDGKREIYRMTSKGEVVRVTDSPGKTESWEPNLTPDGQILFTSNRDGKREIYRMTSKGKVVRVSHSPGNTESWGSIQYK